MVATSSEQIEEIETAYLIRMIEFWVDQDSPYFKEVFAQDKKVFQLGKSKAGRLNFLKRKFNGSGKAAARYFFCHTFGGSTDHQTK